jgi:peptide chain release factor 1
MLLQRHNPVASFRQIGFQQHQCRCILSAAVQKRVEAIVTQHDDIMARLSEGGNTSSMGKELSSLAPVARLQEKLTLLNDEETSMKELLEDAISLEDKDLETECQEELKKIEESRAVLEKRVIESVLPKDEDDAEAAILEVRAGTGGDEAALFAGDLLDAYSKSAKSQGWKVETLSVTKTDLGGIKEGSVSISGGGGSYGYDDSDDNVDRVQRVPVNDVRIHTSACSVAVLPSPSDERADNLLPMSELRIDTMRASGAGGQHVNTTDSAVRITHLPTGITASIQDERSQHKNKAKALKLIAARVMALRRADEARERGDARNSLMGGGDRSERIRTYNFPQDRVTDHRCKESEHGITRLLGGSSEDGLVVTFAPIMRAMSRDEALRQLEEER